MTGPDDTDRSDTPGSTLPADQPAANPFAAPVRAPRERWLNPAKRRPVGALAALAALVLLGAGVLIGLAVGGDGHGRHGGRDVQHGRAQWSVPRGGYANDERRPGANFPGRDGGWYPGRHDSAPSTAGPLSTSAPASGASSPAAPTSSHS